MAAVIVALLVCSGLAFAQELQLKARRGAGLERAHTIEQPMKAWLPGRLHILLRVPVGNYDDFTAALESRGIRPLAYVPDGWLSISVPENMDWSGLEAFSIDALKPDDKISPELASLDSGYFIAEFHPDVDGAEARAIALAEGLELVEHPDLLSSQILVRGSLAQVRLVAGWDEVAYVFPASTEIQEGRAAEACNGAQAGGLTIGQYVARVGDGWDGPGRNAASLAYSLLKITAKLPSDFVRSEFDRALAEWARHVDIHFAPSNDPGSARTLTLSFAARAHGDPFAFDGPGRVLAHTYYPSPPNPEPIAGDLHFDDDENWASRGELDFFSVALHELGHALGLAHSDRPGSVMYPYYRRAAALTQEDISAIQTLYAPRGSSGPPSGPAPLAVAAEPPLITGNTANLRGTVSGGTGEPKVSWTSNRGGSGIAPGGRSWTIAALPLAEGLNTITITATDAAGSQASRLVTLQPRASAAALTLWIGSPTTAAVYQTTSALVALSGTAEGAARVTWANSRGGSGQAAGTSTWTINSVALQAGSNLVTVTASAADGRTTSRSIDIRYEGRDTTAPSLQILSPSTTSAGSSAASIVFRGTARDSGEVAEVTWANSNGPSGLAEGTNSWTTPPIPLLVGVNHITIRARDNAGNSTWRSVTVTRR